MFAFTSFAINLDWNFTFNSGDIQLKFVGPYTKICLTDGSDPHDAIGAPAITDPEFVGVVVKDEAMAIGFEGGVFVGTYSFTLFDYADPNILFIGAGNQLTYPKVGAKIGACRAYFDFNDYYYAKVRSMGLNYGTEGVTSIESSPLKMPDETGAWRTLDGREISQRPTAKGVYLHGDRKVLIHQ